MQPTILAITLVIMAVTLLLILRAILPTTGSEPDADAPKMLTRLIWVMIALEPTPSFAWSFADLRITT